MNILTSATCISAMNELGLAQARLLHALTFATGNSSSGLEHISDGVISSGLIRVSADLIQHIDDTAVEMLEALAAAAITMAEVAKIKARKGRAARAGRAPGVNGDTAFCPAPHAAKVVAIAPRRSGASDTYPLHGGSDDAA